MNWSLGTFFAIIPWDGVPFYLEILTIFGQKYKNTENTVSHDVTVAMLERNKQINGGHLGGEKDSFGNSTLFLGKFCL